MQTINFHLTLPNMLTSIRNQSPFSITLSVLAVIAVIMLSPVESVLGNTISDDFKLEYLSLTLKMGSLFLIGYGLIRALKTQTLGGLSSQFPWRSKYLNLIPVYLFLIGLLSVSSRDFSQINSTNLILLLMACLTVGFAEEYIFRGLLIPLFLRKFSERKRGIFESILLASLFFGIFHLLNLTKNDNVGQVLVQVVYAIFIGFFFGVLLLKTNKLIPLAITHGLINFFFSLAILPGIKTMEDEAADAVSIAPIILFLPLLIIGLLIYKKMDKGEIIKKIEIDNTEIEKA